MPMLESLSKGIGQLKTGEEPAEIGPDQVEVVNLSTVSDAIKGIESAEYPDLSPALAELQKTLEAASDKREQGLERAVKALAKVLDKFKVDVAAPNVNLEATISTEEIAAAIREMVPEQKAVKFDINRNRNGFIESVIATPLGD